jgi:hypothetical protein
LKDGPSDDQIEGSQGRTGPRSEFSADGKAKPDVEKILEVAVEKNSFGGEGRDQDRSWDQFTTAAKPDWPVSQTGPSDFFSFRIEEALEYYCDWDSPSTSLVSSIPHAQPEEEDLVDEGVKDEGRSGREGERHTHQRHTTSDPDEIRVDGEGEGWHHYTHDLWRWHGPAGWWWCSLDQGCVSTTD